METTVVSYGVHTHNVQQQQKQIMEEGRIPHEWVIPVLPSSAIMPPPQ